MTFVLILQLETFCFEFFLYRTGSIGLERLLPPAMLSASLRRELKIQHWLISHSRSLVLHDISMDRVRSFQCKEKGGNSLLFRLRILFWMIIQPPGAIAGAVAGT
jgi:hypothetical protein